MTWGADAAISAALSTSLTSQGLQMFHVMTRFGTTSLTASAGWAPAKRAPVGALGPTSATKTASKAPANNRTPVLLPSTLASSR